MARLNRRTFLKTAALAAGALPLAANEKTPAHETLRFIHVTDSHMDMSDPDTVDALKLMVAFVNKHYPHLDFVLFGGDNFNNNVPGDKDARTFKSVCDALHCPYYSVRGNKESSPKPANDPIGPKAFADLFLSREDLEVEGLNWALARKGHLVLGLDSCIEHANNGRYTEQTLRFAERMLSKKMPTVILNHHPYTNYWGGTDPKDLHKYVLGNTDEAQKRLFGFPNLRLTLSGHKHIDSVTKIGHVTVAVTRGFIRPLDLDMFPMRYVEMTGDKVQEKLIYTA